MLTIIMAGVTAAGLNFAGFSLLISKLKKNYESSPLYKYENIIFKSTPLLYISSVLFASIYITSYQTDVKLGNAFWLSIVLFELAVFLTLQYFIFFLGAQIPMDLQEKNE